MRWPRALLVWVLIALAETVHGVLRTLLVTPVLGDLAARQLGVLVGCGLIFAISVATVRWMGARTLRAQLAIGAAWAVLMLAFELGLGLALGLDTARLSADYDPRQGGFMAFGMAFLVAAPALAARARKVKSRGHGLRRAAWLIAGFTALVAAVWVALALRQDPVTPEARLNGVSQVADVAREYRSR